MELPLEAPISDIAPEPPADNDSPSALILQIRDCKLFITDSVPERTLSKVLKVIRNA